MWTAGGQCETQIHLAVRQRCCKWCRMISGIVLKTIFLSGKDISLIGAHFLSKNHTYASHSCPGYWHTSIPSQILDFAFFTDKNQDDLCHFWHAVFFSKPAETWSHLTSEHVFSESSPSKMSFCPDSARSWDMASSLSEQLWVTFMGRVVDWVKGVSHAAKWWHGDFSCSSTSEFKGHVHPTVVFVLGLYTLRFPSTPWLFSQYYIYCRDRKKELLYSFVLRNNYYWLMIILWLCLSQLFFGVYCWFPKFSEYSEVGQLGQIEFVFFALTPHQYNGHGCFFCNLPNTKNRSKGKNKSPFSNDHCSQIIQGDSKTWTFHEEMQVHLNPFFQILVLK